MVLLASQITVDSPIHLEVYHWASYLKAPGLSQYHEWIAKGRPTGSYDGPAPNYLLVFDYNKCEDFGSEAGMVNHALEICFGSRGASRKDWSIWIQGDHLITLFRDIRDEYQRLLSVEGEDLFLLDLWLKDLTDAMKALYVYGLFPNV
jgi:hypothetical protein